MFDRVSQIFEKSAKMNKHQRLETHQEMIEAGGIQKWISLANLKFKYMFRSSDEILEMIREDKAELEDLDYIG